MSVKPIEIWWMPISGLRMADVMPWLSLLDEKEAQQAKRFVNPQRQIEYIAGHALARTALSALAGAPPHAWKFVPGAFGKPFPLLNDKPSDYYFSLTGTKDMVAVAVSQGNEMGLDIENLGRMTGPKVIFACSEHEEESALLRDLEPAQQAKNFLHIWTLKEAYLKATGRGLNQELNTFWFNQIHPPSIRFKDINDDEANRWSFEQKILFDGQFVSALAFKNKAKQRPDVFWKRSAPADIKIPAHVR